MKTVVSILLSIVVFPHAFGLRPPEDPAVTFARVVLDADRALIRTGGMCHRDPEMERVVKEVSGADEVAAFAKRIAFTGAYATVASLPTENGEDEDVAMNCMCCGDYTFEFFRHERKIASLSIHHWEHVRSAEIAEGADLAIAPASIAALQEILRIEPVADEKAEANQPVTQRRGAAAPQRG